MLRRTLPAILLLTLFACDHPRAPSGLDRDPWAERDDAALTRAIEDARRAASESDRRVLLDFVAPWCTDCREVIRVSHRDPARSVIEARYVVVYVNVGRFDRHQALIREHDVDRIATLVVLDPASGRRVARTTLEPITTGAGLTPDELARWLRAPSG